jgi:hypothetical protein
VAGTAVRMQVRKRRRRRAATVAIAATATALATACGGLARTDEPAPSGTADPAPDAAAPTLGSGDPSGVVDLPECRLGFLVEERAQRSCVFVVGGRCYEGKLDACACACKKASGTLCLSGFPEPDGTTNVTCG